MKTTNGDVITQYDLHRLESVSLIKIDLLSIEALDRIRACLDLLTKYGYIDSKLSLREKYEQTIGVYNLDRKKPEMWKMIHNHQIENLFQMEQQSGVKGIAAVKPTTLEELATLNSVIRLMAQEKGAEQPIDKFARFKKDIGYWYEEMDSYGLTKEEQKLLEPILLDSSGICESQEKFMSLVQLPEAGGFSLLWADKLRKSIAKKDPAQFEKLEEEFYKVTAEKDCSKSFCNYVWKVLVSTSKGYGFNLSHTIGYSIIALQEMNLAYKYPIIFWNTANLIVDSGAMNLEQEFEEIENDDDEELKQSSTNYGKVATAIGKMKSRGLNFSLPDINKSDITFTPNVKENKILYGLRGITGISNQNIKEIFKARPFISIPDFCKKIKMSKPKIINLIKSGAFDSLYPSITREKIMEKYIDSIAGKKKRITLQNMQMLIKEKIIPQEFDFEIRLFNFNKYLKRFSFENFYKMDATALRFYKEKYDLDLLENLIINGIESSALILKTKWDSIYKKDMDPIRKWMKENQQEILDNLNKLIIDEVEEKYANGNISKWEMDSLSFYYHEHELEKLQNYIYNIVDFNSLSEEPNIEKEFPTNNGDKIQIYQISRIAGTVIDKDKNKNQVTLLTTTGVVIVKIWKNQFVIWDRQLAERDNNGDKHVVEKSWFTRGTKLIITGIRRDNTFIPKKYKNTPWPLFERIDKLDDNGFILESSTERQKIQE